MQRRTTWDQSISSGLTSPLVRQASGAIVAASIMWPEAGCAFVPVARGSSLRRTGFGGTASPTTLQLNVPTHCIVGLTKILQTLFHTESRLPVLKSERAANAIAR